MSAADEDNDEIVTVPAMQVDSTDLVSSRRQESHFGKERSLFARAIRGREGGMKGEGREEDVGEERQSAIANGKLEVSQSICWRSSGRVHCDHVRRENGQIRTTKKAPPHFPVLPQRIGSWTHSQSLLGCRPSMA